MKASIIAIAASSLVGGAAASSHHRHLEFHARKANVLERGASNSTCGCSYSTTTIYGAMTLHPKPPPAPTPVVSSYSAPGTYTISKSTITLTDTTTVASASTASLTPGTCSYGGVTTSVSAPTTVTVPYGTVEGTSPATTSVVKTSTHYCSEAGTCIIALSSTSVSTSTVVVYPVPATYTPGTYTIPETTITVTETGTVYVCPFSSAIPTPSAKPSPKPSSYASPAPAPSTSEAPVPKPKPLSYQAPKPETPSTSASPVEESPKPKPLSYQAPKPETPSTSASPVEESPKPKPSNKPSGGYGSGSAGIKPNGNKWALAYTPYTPSGACKMASEVDSDIAKIAQLGFSSVRLYAPDCSGLENVGGACKKHGLKILLGIFIDESGLEKAGEQVTDIVAWGKAGNWDIVEMCVVGNEAIFNNYVSASELAGFISSTKSTLKAAGCDAPVTTTEPLGTLMANKGEICDVVDVVAANIQPYFNEDVLAPLAGTFVAAQLALTGLQCPGKEAYNLECGWPWNGSPNGKAVPGVSQQKEAIDSILSSSAASKTVVFSYQNDAWKGAGDKGVEPYFGCADIL